MIQLPGEQRETAYELWIMHRVGA